MLQDVIEKLTYRRLPESQDIHHAQHFIGPEAAALESLHQLTRCNIDVRRRLHTEISLHSSNTVIAILAARDSFRYFFPKR